MNVINLYIVDEYLLTRIATKEYFKKDKNFKILDDFSNMKQCLKKMEKERSDIILLDISQSNSKYLKELKTIKEKYPKTKVIALASNNDDNKIFLMLASGVCGYVLKDNVQDLKEVMEIVAKGGFWMDLKIARSVFAKITAQNARDIENFCQYKTLRNSLTKREMEVLKLMIEGKTNSQIASEIIVSTNTAKAHVGSILTKLSAKDRVQAVVKAVKANLF